MPFIAHKNNRTVIPEEVSDGEDVVCPTCSEQMRVRGPFKDGTARHFFHPPGSNADGCSGVSERESDTHRKLKSLAVSGLRQRYDDAYQRCRPEVSLDVSDTETGVNERRADALLEFHDRNRFYGRGIIVEVQHLNQSKDIRATTHDYLQLDFSVYWATVEDFMDDQFQIEQMEDAFNENAPPAFSPYHSTPPRLDAPEPLSVSMEDESMYSTMDPVPECSHEFIPHEDGGKICVRCTLRAEYCKYVPHLDRLRLNRLVGQYQGGDLVLAADTTSIEHPIEVRDIEEYGDPPHHTHEWGRTTDVFEDKHRCTRCDSVLLVTDDRIVIQHEASDEWRSEEHN